MFSSLHPSLPVLQWGEKGSKTTSSAPLWQDQADRPEETSNPRARQRKTALHLKGAGHLSMACLTPGWTFPWLGMNMALSNSSHSALQGHLGFKPNSTDYKNNTNFNNTAGESELPISYCPALFSQTRFTLSQVLSSELSNQMKSSHSKWVQCGTVYMGSQVNTLSVCFSRSSVPQKTSPKCRVFTGKTLLHALNYFWVTTHSN